METIKNKEPIEHEMKIRIREYDKNAMFLRVHITDGTTAEEEKFELSMNISNDGLIYKFPEATYVINLRQLTDAMIHWREMDKVHNPETKVKK